MRNGPDWITTFEAGDGETEVRSSFNVNASFPKGVKVQDVVQQLIGITGLKKGDLVKRIQAKGFQSAFSEFTRGVTVTGSAHKKIVELGKSLGLQVMIQDGTYTAADLDRGTISLQQYKLTPSTGLINAPEIGEEGTVRAQCLLLPALRPMQKVQLKSAELDGEYRIEKATHSGSYRGGGWNTDLELKPV